VLLHEADRIKPINHETIKKDFGLDVAGIVQGLRKIAELNLKTTALQAETFRRLLLTYSSDPRVIIIKLADRLEVMRSLSFFPKSKHAKKAAETQLLFAPLAHKLGLYKLKSELEDLALRYTEPSVYRDITTKLKLNARIRSKLLHEFIAPIKQELLNKNYLFELKYRTKSVYSIWNKMQKQGKPFEQVHDVFAIRIIVDTKFASRKEEASACWDIYSMVTARYEPDQTRLRDWVTQPKPNGYESLHATLKVVGGQDVEVQIRTRRMDNEAENGSAAHWRYKGVEQAKSQMESWLVKVRQQLESDGKLENEHGLATNDVFVFTPNGDLRQLKAGATVLDFAFDIHSNLGSRCSGAIRNGRNVPIREVLQTGDEVEIITSKNQSPTLDWLNYVNSTKAKNRIRQKLREDEAKLASSGRETLERKLKNWKITSPKDPIAFIVKHFKLKSPNDLYIKLALDELDVSLVHSCLQKHEKGEGANLTPTKELPKEGANKVKSPSKSIDSIVIDEQLQNVEYKFGKCCTPVYGDDIFGFVTIGSGITIHRTNCPNADRLLAQYDYRVIPAHWQQQENTNLFQVQIKIVGNNEAGLQFRITNVTNNYAVGGIRTFTLEKQKDKLEGKFRVLIKNAQQLEALLYQLRMTKGVERVQRLDG
ncbi:MAG: RelA/SpoT family protein, partial [Bacteroidales bacterium]